MLFFTGCESHEISFCKNLKSGGVWMTIAGEAINDKTARVTAGDEIENEGDEGEDGEEGAEVSVAHHHVEPHLLRGSAGEPRQAPVCRCHPPPVRLLEFLHLGTWSNMLIVRGEPSPPPAKSCR